MKDRVQQKDLEQLSLYRVLYFISGIFLVIIGIIGIFLPLLPTTIFLILASGCFVKVSPKANEWLYNHKILGVYLKNYRDKSGLTVKAKMINILLLWLMISISVYFFTEEFLLRLLLLAIAVGVTIHLLMVKTKRV